MVKNEDYWNKERQIPLNKIINRFVTDTSARAIEIESGADVYKRQAMNGLKRTPSQTAA